MVTGRLWPMRWARSEDWSSTAGFQMDDVVGAGNVKAGPLALRLMRNCSPSPPLKGINPLLVVEPSRYW